MKIYPYLVVYTRRNDLPLYGKSACATYHLTRSGAIRAMKRGKVGFEAETFERDPFQLKRDDLPVWAGVFKDDWHNHYARIAE